MSMYLPRRPPLFTFVRLLCEKKKKVRKQEFFPHFPQTNFHINTTKTTPVFSLNRRHKGDNTTVTGLVARKHRRGVWRQCPARLLEPRRGEKRFDDKKLTDVPGTMSAESHTKDSGKQEDKEVTVMASNCYHKHATVCRP